MHDDLQSIRASFLTRSANYLGLIEAAHDEISRGACTHWPLPSQPGPHRNGPVTRAAKPVEERAAATRKRRTWSD